MHIIQNRRGFLAGAAAAGAASLFGSPKQAFAEAPPETTAVRLPAFPKIADCMTPIYISQDLLRAEGFADITLVTKGTGPDSSDWIEHGEVDFDWNYPPAHIRSIAKGVPITVLSGLHVGCLELIANDRVRTIPDLRGKRAGVDDVNGNTYLLLMMIAAYVGLDPANDIEWITTPDPVEAFAEGKIDAFLGTAPVPQIMRERNLGHVILKTSVDRPWAHYYCCMLAGTNEFVQRYPVAAKRVLRALLKAVDFCLSDPAAAAKAVVANGLGSRDDYIRQAFGAEVLYDKWREYDPEDSIRFYALRLQETGMITSDPQTIIANGTDWRFLDELKQELKT
ncbi:ABC transporter substrate-binding protein [Mesorhizobium dulcispinae]|uniref:ABC transporter substrate-binding protein n=1 Tax=Mesorhizobium dulcispinae TaxID=3072316 RepID=UPI002A24AF9D|nr:ABC transporter substrate-binding protein [Mesorhizobium sp. VK23D]MDX8521503.1 ABC transporter substrate-binding protein [Mesorhizobium sp. VK23D]